jgi:hypothetical protein
MPVQEVKTEEYLATVGILAHQSIVLGVVLLMSSTAHQ